MLHVILKFDQNLIRFLLQNWSKFNQKLIKNRYRIEGWFRNRYFFDFWSNFDQFWTNFGSKTGPIFGPKLVPDASQIPKWTPKRVWASPGTVLEGFCKHFWKIFDEIRTNFKTKICFESLFPKEGRRYSPPGVFDKSNTENRKNNKKQQKKITKSFHNL